MAEAGAGSGPDAGPSRRPGPVELATAAACIALATLCAAVALPPPVRVGDPPGVRELLPLVGTSVEGAEAALSRLRIHRTHNDPNEFFYASPDGCHGHLGLRLATFGGLVLGWSRSRTEPSRGCLARTVASGAP